MGAAAKPLLTIQEPEHPRPPRTVKARKLFEPELVRGALKQAFVMLRPDIQWANPVMFVVEIGAVLTLLFIIEALVSTSASQVPITYFIALDFWLFLTVLFANFATALAEARGKAQADSLRKTRTETPAYRLKSGDVIEEVPSTDLRPGDLADQLLENELFGHVRGAFTGAVSESRGRLEAAERGTVVFDEIAELPSSLQARFLRFVQDQSFERIGSDRTIRVNVRIIATSNRDLEAAVAAGRFREDLYYRLNVLGLRLPPLRERTLDVLPLATWMLRQASIKSNRAEFRLSPEAAGAFASYRWPGNVRELHNALEHATTVARTEIITLGDLPDHFYRGAHSMFLPSPRGTALRDREREYILRVMAESPTLAAAAGRLGIDTTTLWRKRRRYGIE